MKDKQYKHVYSYFHFLQAETPRNLNQVTLNYQYQSSMCRVLTFCGTTFVETAVENRFSVFLSSYGNTRESLGELEKAALILPNFHSCFYLTIRLWARDFYRVIVDEGAARVYYRTIEIESE